VAPLAGRIAVENTGGSSRKIAVSKTDADGFTRNLGVLKPGDTVTITDDPATPPITGYARYDLTSDVVDAGSYYTVTANRVDTSGTTAPPAVGTRLRVLAYLNNSVDLTPFALLAGAAFTGNVTAPGLAPDAGASVRNVFFLTADPDNSLGEDGDVAVVVV
jgi:hypothetical protein